MINFSKRIIELIEQGKTLNEISGQLNLTHKQIYTKMRTMSAHGIEFEREYFYNGNIKYIPDSKYVYTNREGVDLITSHEDQQLTFMLISDLHFGNKTADLELLTKIYDYCVMRNIHIIINAGDLIDGLTYGTDKKIKSFERQIDFAINNYPFDKNILNFICLGNHDLDSFTTDNMDLHTILYNFRHDLIPLGYALGGLNVKNETIYIKHRIADYQTSYIPNESLILLGHSHKSSIQLNGNLYVHIPPLSNISNNRNGFPGATIMTLTFKNGYYKSVFFEQLLIADKIYTINEFRTDLFPNRVTKKKTQTILELNDGGTYIKESKEVENNTSPQDGTKKLTRKQKKQLRNQKH